MSRSITSRSGQAAPSFEVLHGPDVFAARAPPGAPPRMHVQVRAPSAWRSRRELASSSSSSASSASSSSSSSPSSPSSSSSSSPSSSSSSSQQQQQQEEQQEEEPAEVVGSGRELVRASCEPAEAWLLDTLQRLRAIRRQAVDAGVEAAAAAAAASPHSEPAYLSSPGAASASSLTQRVVIPASTFGAQMGDATAAGVVWDGPARGRLDALAHWSLGPVLERCSLQVRSAAVFHVRNRHFGLETTFLVCRSKSCGKGDECLRLTIDDYYRCCCAPLRRCCWSGQCWCGATRPKPTKQSPMHTLHCSSRARKNLPWSALGVV
jgi:hypothetical protein